MQAEADKLKNEGNKLFADHKFQPAIEAYTKAIEIAPTAILYANRAFAHIKLESYGSAIEDATKAIELDPTYVKAYYRRGSASLALRKFKDSLRDFKEAVKIAPKDRDCRVKYKECEKAYKEARWSDAIAVDHLASSPFNTIGDIDAIVVDSDYDGPHLQGPITLDFVVQMIEHFKKQKRLHKKYVLRLLSETKKIFEAEATLVDFNFPAGGRVTVFGDVHGQFYDLLNVFQLNGYPSETNPCVFNGDFVDRGSFSTEVILTLLAFKYLYPQHVFLNRGNHEAQTMNKVYGFEGEVKAKYSQFIYELFTALFCTQPLGTLINNKILVVHGGLFSKDGVTLDDIRTLDRFREPPDEGIMCDIMWADPQPQPGRSPSKRGVGLSFGPDVTKRFLEQNNLEYVVRSHECKDGGYEVAHDGRCITVFSAPNYCDQVGNKGSIVIFKDDLKPNFVTFDAVPHPDMPPMAYASNYSSMFGL
jgi:serine/threonine-protein phosphatase 5